MKAKIKRNFQVFSACDFVAPTIAIIPTLIAAGSVAHDVMTAIKSGSAGDDCGSLSVSTALATALVAFVAFKYALFPVVLSIERRSSKSCCELRD